MKLYTTAGSDGAPSPQTQLVRLAAKLMQIEGLQTVQVGPEDATLRRKSLTGRFPVLEDGEAGGVIITDSLPIARHLTRENSTFSSGSCLEQKVQIDTWIDYIQGSVTPAAARVIDMVTGKATCADQRTFSVALNDLKQALAPIDGHLALRNFLVGHQMTLADALLISTVAVCFELVLDKKTRDSSLQNVSRYTTILLKMAPCARVFGAVAFCKDVTTPCFDAPKPKKAEGEQQQQQQQKKKGKGKPQAAAEEEKKQ